MTAFGAFETVAAIAFLPPQPIIVVAPGTDPISVFFIQVPRQSLRTST